MKTISVPFKIGEKELGTLESLGVSPGVFGDTENKDLLLALWLNLSVTWPFSVIDVKLAISKLTGFQDMIKDFFETLHEEGLVWVFVCEITPQVREAEAVLARLSEELSGHLVVGARRD